MCFRRLFGIGLCCGIVWFGSIDIVLLETRSLNSRLSDFRSVSQLYYLRSYDLVVPGFSHVFVQ
jgi:hypothetical protein